jgi:hypothetical protein
LAGFLAFPGQARRVRILLLFHEKKSKFVHQTIFIEKATLFDRFSINNSLLEFGLNRSHFTGP